MDSFAVFIFSLYEIFFVVLFALLIYLIIRRFNIMDQEIFEKRNN